jgi:hypothetical protein
MHISSPARIIIRVAEGYKLMPAKFTGPPQVQADWTDQISLGEDLRASVSLEPALRALSELWDPANDYGDGFLAPASASFWFAWDTVRGALARVEALAESEATPIGDGGLTIGWELDDANVRMVVPPDPSQACVYLKSHSQAEITRASVESLAEALRLLSAR